MALYVDWKGVRYYKKNLKIKRYGQRLDGYIYDLEHNIDVGGRQIHIEYFLIIKYFNPFTNQEMLYKTPRINFNPIEDLGSRNCSVYIYNNEIYVSDFVNRLPNQNRIWSEEIIKSKNYNALLKEGTLKIFKFLGVLILILFILAILLNLF